MMPLLSVLLCTGMALTNERLVGQRHRPGWNFSSAWRRLNRCIVSSLRQWRVLRRPRGKNSRNCTPACALATPFFRKGWSWSRNWFLAIFWMAKIALAFCRRAMAKLSSWCCCHCWWRRYVLWLYTIYVWPVYMYMYHVSTCYSLTELRFKYFIILYLNLVYMYLVLSHCPCINEWLRYFLPSFCWCCCYSYRWIQTEGMLPSSFLHYGRWCACNTRNLLVWGWNVPT